MGPHFLSFNSAIWGKDNRFYLPTYLTYGVYYPGIYVCIYYYVYVYMCVYTLCSIVRCIFNSPSSRVLGLTIEGPLCTC